MPAANPACIVIHLGISRQHLVSFKELLTHTTEQQVLHLDPEELKRKTSEVLD